MKVVTSSSIALALFGAMSVVPISIGKAAAPSSPCDGASYAERGQCADLHIAAAKEKLRKALIEFRATLTTKFARDQFELEQANWEKFQQSACRFLGDRELFGTNGPTFDYGDCQVTIIEQRISSLKTNTYS